MKTIIICLTILACLATFLFVLPDMMVLIMNHSECHYQNHVLTCHYNEP